MLILHNLQSEAMDHIIEEYFMGYLVKESDYILCTKETPFFSKSILRKLNGIKVYILASPMFDENDHLEWEGKLMSDDERYKSSSTYGEQNLQAFPVEFAWRCTLGSLDRFSPEYWAFQMTCSYLSSQGRSQWLRQP
jgi:hypothetical protein